MSARPRGAWAGRGSGLPALRQLEAAVAQLHRARWVQALVEDLASALCVGLFAASALVLGIRLGAIPWRADLAVAGVLAGAVAAALALAWRHRPDDLRVAIDADVKLNLKQQMSTAWELARERGDDELARRLARQAVRARLPGRSAAVFPLRVNGLGLATPVGVILLLLVAIVDLPRPGSDRDAEVDASVVSEGLRLREYGLRMEARAQRDELPRSEAGSRKLQRLGDRMNAGTLSRDQALQRLRDLGRELDAERQAALDSGSRIDVGPLSTRPLSGSPGGLPGAAGLLRRLEAGELGDGEVRALAADPAALAASGVSREELERALAQAGAGDDAGLHDILDRMARAERGDRDAEALRRAQERITRARENLGDAAATPGSGAPDAAASARAASPQAGAPDASFADGAAEEDAGGGSVPGLAGGTGPRERREGAGPAPGDGPVLEADPRLDRRGDVFVSEGRALPRSNDVNAPERALAPQFRAQMEAVLASERYPAHYKDYIRRYFLSLSEGTRTDEAKR